LRTAIAQARANGWARLDLTCEPSAADWHEPPDFAADFRRVPRDYAQIRISEKALLHLAFVELVSDWDDD
jgi:hypothetical protein